ncbi:MAG: leucine-rich repeat domain-containing protein [Bacilli bacterium]|nr:leucine-rich repeat domain-containing protein [Bacilli bacterium]MDD4734412.1 leucine-rich repeat domain-containing protein [Bacilli bacterium]
MKKRGFTLIEVLGIIVIIGIILLIVFPAIAGILEEAEKASFRNSVMGIVKTAEDQHSRLEINGDLIENKYSYKNGVENSQNPDLNLKYKGKKPKNGEVVVDDKGIVEAALDNGKWCVKKLKNSNDYTITDLKDGECNLTGASCEGELVTNINFGNGIKAYRDGNQLCLLGSQAFIEEGSGGDSGSGASALAIELTNLIIDMGYTYLFSEPDDLFAISYVAFFEPEGWEDLKNGDTSLWDDLYFQVIDGYIIPEDVFMDNPDFLTFYNELPAFEELDGDIEYLVEDLASFIIDNNLLSPEIPDEVSFSLFYIAFYYDVESWEETKNGNDQYFNEVLDLLEDGTISIGDVLDSDPEFGIFVNMVFEIIMRSGPITFNNKKVATLMNNTNNIDIKIKNFSATANLSKLIGIEKVLIRGDIKEIGRNAFVGGLVPIEGPCDRSGTITEVYIESDVEVINDSAFYCNSLTTVVMPNSVKTIKRLAFEENQIDSLVLSNQLTTIEDSAFARNYISEVNLSNKLTHIGNYAFQYNLIDDLTLPNTVEMIGVDAFKYNEISEIIIPNSVKYLSGFSSNNISEIIIPNSVEEIGPNAFLSNQLTEVTIPNSVLKIGYLAFSYNDITNVQLPNNLTSLSGFNSNNLNQINIPNTVKEIGDYAFDGNNISVVNLPEGIEKFGEYAFSSNGILNLTLPASTKEIGEFAFSSNGIKNVVFPEGITELGGFARNQITSLVIPSTVTEIGDYAFVDNYLTSLVIPSSVQNIGRWAFEDNNISNLTLNEGLIRVDSGAFSSNNLTSLNIPSSVTYLSGFISNKITSLYVPPNVQTIGSSAFRYNQISELTLSEGLERIEYSAFGRNKISSLTIPSTVRSLAGFEDNLLTTINIPNTVTYLDMDVFANNLFEEITLPEGITSLPSRAVAGNKLTSLIIPANVTNLGSYCLTYNNLTSITIGSNVSMNSVMTYNSNDQFRNAYNANNKQAGTYIGTQTGTWSYSGT